ncbi:MAG: helix-turn-helix domain-containing protein, partial [bacterium]|nr:helix-turn-helix domain-containing protein [bacterium]
MVDRKTVFEIHRLKNEGCSNRKIAGIMGINRQTVSKYIR